MSTTYVDSGVLVKIYAVESDSSRAASLIASRVAPMVLCQWQSLEVRTALRVKLFRREISPAQLRDALALLDDDVAQGVLQPTVADMTAVFHEAERLSSRFASTIGCRTLDIHHVAAAIVLGADEFISMDQRQRALASAAGLRVKP